MTSGPTSGETVNKSLISSASAVANNQGFERPTSGATSTAAIPTEANGTKANTIEAEATEDQTTEANDLTTDPASKASSMEKLNPTLNAMGGTTMSAGQDSGKTVANLPISSLAANTQGQESPVANPSPEMMPPPPPHLPLKTKKQPTKEAEERDREGSRERKRKEREDGSQGRDRGRSPSSSSSGSRKDRSNSSSSEKRRKEEEQRKLQHLKLPHKSQHEKLNEHSGSRGERWEVVGRHGDRRHGSHN